MPDQLLFNTISAIKAAQKAVLPRLGKGGEDGPTSHHPVADGLVVCCWTACSGCMAGAGWAPQNCPSNPSSQMALKSHEDLHTGSSRAICGLSVNQQALHGKRRES